MNTMWLVGMLRRRPARLVAASAGIAVAVALLACLGSFLAHSKSTMTDRAIRGVAVDWQVQVQPGTDPAGVARTVQTSPGVRGSVAVGFAQTTGLAATSGGSSQVTGAGVVLGLPDNYRALFPAQIRTLVGADHGALLAQQTAANLHAAPGDTITIAPAGLPVAKAVIAGVIDLPQADSLFQKVGAPVGTQRSAPPDNVMLLPAAQWHSLFDPLATARPDLLSTQIHVLREHALPQDPAAAFTSVTGAARNLEARSSGAAIVGDNLGAALGAARQDAAYAQVLFLFLGLPGAILAALLTSSVAASGAARRRGEQALLRARGATARDLMRIAGVEAAFIGITGAALGLAGAAVIGRTAFGSARFGTTTATAVGWAACAALAGVGIAAAAVLLPARRDLRESTVAASRAGIGVLRHPVWARYRLDAALLIIAGLTFSATSDNGYQLVLAPEGVPGISVSYWAFAGPALLWIGAGLLVWRLADLALGRGRGLISRLLRPFTGRLAGIIANGMSRQRRPLASAVVLLALAISFAASTATFNATYRQQAEADAQLTNGADITVTQGANATARSISAAALAGVPGVKAVEPIQHHFAYVGTDLQDLYGVRPESITHATALRNAYFKGGTATGLMKILAAKPDSILISAETVKDFQLQVGDQLKLRMLNSHTNHLSSVVFHYAGVVTEFPTAPKDSFFVANATYIAEQTGTDAVGAFLINTGAQHSKSVARRIQRLLGPAAGVTDIATVRKSVGSSLTAVDLAGLTRVELSFALVLAATAGGLVLALGLSERRRAFAIATALGAKPRHLRAMIFSEAGVITIGGLSAGASTGWVLSEMLVKVLTGVFDPPPSVIAVPWFYLSAVAATTALALAAVGAAAANAARRPAISVLREL
jgi:putative ABC transport system permease protein